MTFQMPIFMQLKNLLPFEDLRNFLECMNNDF